MGKRKPKSKGTKPSANLLTDAIANSINSEVRAAALSAVNQHFLMKVCRLCETRDGPFVNIFDPETLTAKKLEDIMPFVIQESDDLPHKICFRCSAKVEELHEFIQKAVKAQDNLSKLVNKKVISKTKTRQLWEEKLNKSNISNDDICDAVIKKAMEGIANLPLAVTTSEAMNEKPPTPVSDKKDVLNKDKGTTPTDLKEASDKKDKLNKKESSANMVSSESDAPNKEVQSDEKSRTTRLSKDPPTEIAAVEKRTRSRKRTSNVFGSEPNVDENTLPEKQSVKTDKLTAQNTDKSVSQKDESPATQKKVVPQKTESPAPQKPIAINTLSFDFDDFDDKKTGVDKKGKSSSKKSKSNKSLLPNEDSSKTKEETNVIPSSINSNPPAEQKNEKPFDILDHISMIKVNGVGVLFQCKLCNRNFLKKEVVMSHGCAKNGGPKTGITKSTPLPPDPPKAPTTVKYINTKTDDSKKPLPNNPTKAVEKSKLKAGPASKVKPVSDEPKKPPEPANTPMTSIDGMPVQLPAVPSLQGLYKLVAGPNNTFQLVEDQKAPEQQSTAPVNNNTPVGKQSVSNTKKRPGPKSKRRNDDEANNVISIESDDETPLQGMATSQPYPVGLFSTVPGPHGSQYPVPVPHGSQFAVPMTQAPYPLSVTHSSQYVVPVHGMQYQVAGPHGTQYLVPGPQASHYPVPPAVQTPAFPAPAAKKQSYTVVQTGNPSKLLISTKPQPAVEEPPKKKTKKGKSKVAPPPQPYNVGIDSDNQQNSDKFFSFVNIDPSQPSYVLPTNSIIQESQISTSTPLPKPVVDGNEDKVYTCNMCPMTFGREKKLLSHIQSHYNKLDEEDQKRSGKKRSRK